MMKAAYWQRGEALDYKNNTDSTIPENTVIRLAKRIGVTGTTIEPGQTGSLHVCGVFEMPKAEGEAITMGDDLYCSEEAITLAADKNVPAGYAAQDSAAAEKTVFVKLLG